MKALALLKTGCAIDMAYCWSWPGSGASSVRGTLCIVTGIVKFLDRRARSRKALVNISIDLSGAAVRPAEKVKFA